MDRRGNVCHFPERGALVALLSTAQMRGHGSAIRALCDDVMETTDGVLAQFPCTTASCLLLSNMGLSEALAFTPLAMAKLPLVEGRFKPFDHQLMTAAFISMHERCYVLSEPRLGKTSSAILAMDWLQRNRLVTGGVLVITTYTTTRSVWATAIRDTLPKVTVKVAHGASREKTMGEPADWYVTNYDSVRISAGAFERAVREGRIGAIVVDELTHVGNTTTKRTKAISRLCSMVPRVVGMTGSPADNLSAVFGMATTVNPARRPCTTMGAWERLVFFQWGMHAWQRSPAKDARERVNATLQPAIRYRKSDVLDLPPVTEQVRDVDLTPEQRVALSDLKQDAMTLLRSGEVITAANGGVLLQRSLQISQGTVGDNELPHGPRTEALLDIVAETNRKVVVYSPFVRGCEMIAAELKAAKVSCAVITGATPGKEREEILRAFQNDPDPKVLVCHPITVGFGTELSAADTMVFSVPLLLGGFVYNQALERLSSVRQTASNINIIHLVGSDVERDVLRKLKDGYKFARVIAEFFEDSAKNLLTSLEA